jgi:serine/threonine-protein kinase
VTAIEIPTPDPRTFDDTSRPFAEAISSRYAVKRMIGRGGMGIVYLARDRRLDRLVAIKTLPPTLAGDPAVRERFLRETRTAGGMAHPNIVPIHGADEMDGHVFFVMSYIDGDSLAVHTQANGRLEPRAVSRYLQDVASALAHAHRRGIIHRDIKAENILIERATDRALVTDFGIARLAEATPLTATGQVLGTVYYVSPEQVTGDTVDARSDIYSLGIVGFLALTGRFPFQGDVASAVLVAHVTRTAPPVASVNPSVPSVLASIIDRCLMKDPAHRYASAGDLLAAIEAALPELDRPAGKPTLSLISDTEAHAVWQRAAELQASTGIQPRPPAVAKPRDAAKDLERTSGFPIADVRAAAAEAGISERYVEHALVERGLAPAAPVAPPASPPAPPSARSIPASGGAPSPTNIEPLPIGRWRRVWAGGPLEVIHGTEVEGEMPSHEVEGLINILREETGKLGRALARTRELVWVTGYPGSRLEVSMVPAHGRTTIRLTRDLRRRSYATVVGSMAVVGMFAGMAIGAITYELTGAGGEEPGVLLGVTSGLGTTLLVTRAALRQYRARMEKRLRAIGDALATRIRERLPRN